jgi:hypothetical protein
MSTGLHGVTTVQVCLGQWFSNLESQEVPGCAANIMKICFKNEKKSICIEIFIHSLKYVYRFSILYAKCTRKCLCFTVGREPKMFDNHCSTSRALDLYSVGARFESRPIYWISWEFSWFSSVTPDKCLGSTSIRRLPLPLPSKFFLIHQSVIP